MGGGGSSRAWWLALAIGVCQSPAIWADASSSGQSGLVHMPDARLAPDGIWRFGLSDADPYSTLWSSVSLFSRIELSGRYTQIDDVPGFVDDPGYGDYKDKSFDAKWQLWRERTYLPAVAIGVQDFTGTQLFNARYLALSKRLGAFDATLGYGERRIDGWFGGVRYTPASHPQLQFLVEYDANRYAADFGAAESGARRRPGGATLGVHYQWGWLGTQVSVQEDNVGVNLYVAVPLSEREFVPKIDEPAPPAVTAEGATLADWRANPAVAAELERRLRAEGFTPLAIQLEGNRLRLALSHPRIMLIGRAAGRAARLVLAAGPRDLVSLEIGFTRDDLPLVTYTFNDLPLLRRYFVGEASAQQLQAAADVRFATPDIARLHGDEVALQPPPAASVRYNEDGDLLRLTPQESWARGVSLTPVNVRLFFNDPGGAFRYDAFAAVDLHRRLAPGWFVDAGARLTWAEDVSDVTQQSNSELPHVRSDIAEYRRRGERLRLETLLLNRYLQLRERTYLRASVGYYEEMFAGIGTQLLYLPPSGPWAFDVSLDALRQRAPGESLGFRDYRVVTAIGALHYRFRSQGITLTARAGRFLAGDEGVRLEAKRRFRSGVEFGAWYTVTNENDETGPGRPGDPYRDKGLFVSIPLASMLPRDSRRRAELSLVDFTRDVGQLVRSPNDLYLLAERDLLLADPENGLMADFDK